jgi:uncharacterized membrane protein
MGIYTFTTLDGFPGDTYGAEAFSINDAGQIVGAYVDSSHLMHGYLYSKKKEGPTEWAYAGPKDDV